MTPRSLKFDKGNSLGDRNPLFSSEFLFRRRENRPWLPELRRQRKLKGWLGLHNPRVLSHLKALLWTRAQSKNTGCLWSRKCPKRIQIPSAKPSCARTCSVGNSQLERGIPYILWNSLIIWQASIPVLGSLHFSSSMWYWLPYSLTWLAPPTFTTFLHMQEYVHQGQPVLSTTL